MRKSELLEMLRDARTRINCDKADEACDILAAISEALDAYTISFVMSVS